MALAHPPYSPFRSPSCNSQCLQTIFGDQYPPQGHNRAGSGYQRVRRRPSTSWSRTPSTLAHPAWTWGSTSTTTACGSSMTGKAWTRMRSAIAGCSWPIRPRPTGLRTRTALPTTGTAHDSRPGNAPAEHLGAVDIPGCDVGAGTFAGVFVLVAHRLIGGRCAGRVFPPPCLDAGFLVGAQDEVPVGEWFAAPAAFVQVEDRPRLRGEPGVAREHPTTMGPGLDGVLVQPAPDGGAADVGDDSSADGLAPDVGAAEAGQWQAGLMWHLASQGLDGDDHVGGKPRGRPGRGSSPRPARRRSKNRLRHLLTICGGVSRRSPITSLDRPSAA